MDMNYYFDIPSADDGVLDSIYYDFDIDPLGIREAYEEQLYQEARACDAEFIKRFGCSINYEEDADTLPF